MILPVLKYGHPTLRKRGAKVERITPEIAQFIRDMFETMYHARGIGLAAQQVGRALQIAIIDVREVKERPSTLFLNDQPADVEEFMPLTLINPSFVPAAEPVAGPEGCLSFPEIYADISRPESIEVSALDERGQPLSFRCGGLLARAIQHEYDHLQGILFIDRMTREKRAELKPELDDLQQSVKASLK